MSPQVGRKNFRLKREGGGSAVKSFVGKSKKWTNKKKF